MCVLLWLWWQVALIVIMMSLSRVFWLMVAPVGNVRYIFHFGNRTLRLLINLLLPVFWHSLSNWSLSDIKRWVTDLMEVVFWKLFNFFFFDSLTDNRTYKVLIEEYDTSKSTYAVRHTEEQKGWSGKSIQRM